MWRGIPTAEHVWADVGRAPTLVLQQVILTHQVLPQAEVGDGDPVSPGGEAQGVREHRQQTDYSRTGTVPACGAFWGA